MPIAKVQLPDGRVARFEVEEGTTPEQVTTFAQSQMQSFQQQPEQAPADLKSFGRDLLQSARQAQSGIVEGALGLSYLPIDALRGVGQLAGVPREYLPASTGEMFNYLQRTGITAPENKDMMSKAVRIAGSVLGGGGTQAAAMKAVTGGVSVTEEAMRQALKKPPGLTAAAKAGYRVPRSYIKQTLGTNLGERFAGKQAVEATAQIRNQPITNKLAAKALGLSDDAEITPDVLSALRGDASKAYEVVKKVGTLQADDAYQQALSAINKRFLGSSKDFPEMSNMAVAKLVDALNKQNISAEGAVETVKNLRYLASGNMRSLNPADKMVGRAQRAAAEALDDLLARGAKSTLNKDAFNNYRAARELIAKTYTVENALNPATGNVVATQLGKQATKGAPLTGELKRAADFARAFPRLSREPSGQPATGGLFEPLVYGIGGSAVTGSPAGLAAAVIPALTKTQTARGLMTTIPRIPQPTVPIMAPVQRGVLSGTPGIFAERPY